MADQACIVVIVRSVGRATLGRALHSIAAQTLFSEGQAELVVLVVDALGCGITLPATSPSLSVRLLSKGAHLNRSTAAQFGLDTAHSEFPGSWALFLDDDDELLPEHLAKLAGAMQAHPQAVGAHTGVVQVQAAANDDGSLEGLAERARFDRQFEPWELLAANHLPIHAVLFDASRVCRAAVRFDAQFDVFEDWDFWLQVQRIGELVHVPGVSARYWLQASGTEATTQTQDGAQSVAQKALHGDEDYWRLWRKWWQEAPAHWWGSLLDFARSARDELTADSLRLATMAQQLEQAHEYQAGLLDLRTALESQLTALRGELDVARTELSAVQHEVEQLGSALQVASAQVQNLRVDKEHLQLSLREVQRARALAQREAQGLQRSLDLSQHQVRELLNSTSWRLTKPLRLLKSGWRALLQLLTPAYRREFLWKLRHRSFRRSPLLRSVWPDPYEAWCAKEESDKQAERASVMRTIVELGALPVGHPNRPLLSVLMPTYNPPLHFLDAAIESLQAQWYPDWQLCIADDASTAPGVREHLQAWARREPRIQLVIREQNGHISAASNSALALARGQWVVLMDQDDLLPNHALWCVVQAIDQYPEAGIVYSDEDKVDGQGRRFGPYFKPAFDPDLIRGQNLISHLGVYRRELALDVGGFRVGYEGSQDHDLALRCLERLRTDQVIHIPRVLYHWRVHENSTASGIEAKPYALDAGLRAVQDHLQRSGVQALVKPHPEIPHHVVLHRWERSLGDGAYRGTPAKWRLLCWGESPSVRAEVPPRLGERLKPLVDALPCECSATAFEPSWLHACGLLKAWAAEVAADGHDMVLLVSDHVAEVANWAGDLEAWLANTAETGVGAVGPARRSETGQLLDAGWLRRSNGSYAPLACGLGRETHGYYGQLSLPHGVSALHGSVVALRLQAIDGEAPGLCLKSGWRMAWTPVTTVQATPGAWTVGGRDEACAETALVFSSAAADAESTSTVDDGDPSYSPHLCEHHLDHRLATAQRGRSTKARKR